MQLLFVRIFADDTDKNVRQPMAIVNIPGTLDNLLSDERLLLEALAVGHQGKRFDELDEQHKGWVHNDAKDFVLSADCQRWTMVAPKAVFKDIIIKV